MYILSLEFTYHEYLFMGKVEDYVGRRIIDMEVEGHRRRKRWKLRCSDNLKDYDIQEGLQRRVHERQSWMEKTSEKQRL